MLGSVGFFKEKVMQEIQRNALSRFQKILKIKMYQFPQTFETVIDVISE